MIKWGGYDPIDWVELPVECFKEINHGFEWVVSVWFRVGDTGVE